MGNKRVPEVTVAAGTLSGAWKGGAWTGGWKNSSSPKQPIAVFKGVPYAAPPTGDQRWRPPAPLQPWSGTRACTRDGAMAIQRNTFVDAFVTNLLAGQGFSDTRVAAMSAMFAKAPKPKQSEDCLHLTIRTPQTDTQAKLPVMVWIHGGDHQDGASTDLIYFSNALPRLGVVTVLINYRLGLMGNFAHPELSVESEHGVAGNYGFLDQIAALEWVRDNIAGFGGDPDNVTVFGESAGGESVMHLMTSSLSRGLFHRAIAQSPANSGQMIHLRDRFLNFDSAEDNSVAFAQALGVTGPDQVSRLRQRPAAELAALTAASSRLGDHFPVIDGHVLPESPFSAFAGHRQAPVPLLIGSNSDEGSLLLSVLGSPMSEFRHQPIPERALQPDMQQAFGSDMDRLVELYPGLDSRSRQAEIDFMGDHMFGARAFWYARHHAAAANPTWLYHFSRNPPSPKQTAGAYHAAEIEFVHGTNLPTLPMTSQDKALGAKMRDYWSTFARQGDPNGTQPVQWPAFDQNSPQWLRLDHQLKAEPVTKVAQYELLNARTQRLVELMAKLTASNPV